MYENGSVTVNQNDFYGVSLAGVSQYLDDIKAVAITEAITALESTGDLFATFRDGWKGKAEETFEDNFTKARNKTIKALNEAYTALTSEINAIAQGWITQDKNVVKEAE